MEKGESFDLMIRIESLALAVQAAGLTGSAALSRIRHIPLFGNNPKPQGYSQPVVGFR